MSPLSINRLPKTPASLLQLWIDDAIQAEIVLPTVASLASAQLPSGRVSNRMVNIKGLNDSGNVLVFSDFNQSRKGKDLHTNSHAALTFYWQKLDRSVRVEGKIKLMSTKSSEPYFDERDKKFRASVLVGEQSQPVNDRQALVDRYQELMQKKDTELSIPHFWCGAELVPDWFEFYQGSPDRISDRITYTLEEKDWKVQRISP